MDQNRGFREVAPPDEAEQHAQRSQLTMNKTGKRSYQRACKVALAKGAALYKGRLLTAQALGAHEGQFASPAKAARRSFQPNRQTHHKFDMEVLTWNAGSITSRVWNEILALLATTEYKNIKIVFLQESHWQQDQVYSSGPWSVLTCGSTSRHKAGLVVLVHSSLAPLSEIRSTSIVPGHLQHVMIPWQRSRIHLLNLYQHVWDSKLSKTENRGRRKDVMTQLENRIQRVPQRDFLIVAGDFNAHAVTERPHIGPSVPHRVRFANADVKTLPSLCKSCGLTALNTWASGHRSTYANSDGTYSSQIDFLLVRLHDARRRSKEAYSDKHLQRWIKTLSSASHSVHSSLQSYTQQATAVCPIHQEYWKKVRQIQAHKRAGTEHNSECQKLVEDIKEEETCSVAPSAESQPKGSSRPIGVISVPGKVLAGAVKTRIAPALQVSSQLQPQFAYIRQRGVRDAIAKACQHLDFAQQLRQEHRRDLHKSQRGARQAQLSGALTISVDLSKAFDSVNRHELLAALDRLGTDPVTKELVVQLHSETSYNMGTSGLEIQVPTSSGIKQGCKLAPALWSALTLLVMSRMEQKWGPDSKQARDILTVFADDFLLQETFSSFPELQKVLLRIEALFQSLEDVGLEVNPTKSKALLMVQGTQQSIFRKKHTMRKEKQLHIVLPSGHKIPIHHKLTYLGVQLSYGSYKDQTVDYRIAQAQGKFELLRHILCSTKALEASKKLEIWRVYVESSLLHGLVATGITSSGLQKLQSKYSRMLRSIFKQHQHYSHIDTKTLFEQYKVQTPQAVLISQMKTIKTH
ncbi:unnamed protein product [Symbiodinium natans]|uniref:Reverse transcriptase domain-containing protein n=1 Tax=Symbiodinium natans TaxID=878477 RepID=A0A812V0M8_9DINO|nr:unnamed protein product [Symbiodinium natans]